MNKKILCMMGAGILVIGILTLVLLVKVPGFY